MKRSEMIDLMDETFKENYKGRTYQEVHEIILDKMEKAGMNPPVIKKTDHRTGLFHGYDAYEWEEE